jgi:hypothetical protein
VANAGIGRGSELQEDTEAPLGQQPVRHVQASMERTARLRPLINQR